MPSKYKQKIRHIETYPLSKTYTLSVDIAARILGYIKIDHDYSHNMYNFALVETSWRNPAIQLLHTHLKFASYDNMMEYLYKIRYKHPNLASFARTICLSCTSGPINPERYLRILVESCPNIISFEVFGRRSNWVNGRVLLAMGTYWPHLVKLSLYSRNRCNGNDFRTAVRGWPNLTYLDLTDVSGINATQYHNIIENLPNLHFLRLSRLSSLVNDAWFPDFMSDSILRKINDTSRLEVIDFNNCRLFTNPAMLSCFNNLTRTLKCLKITGCIQIAGITLANILVACDMLRFVDFSRSSFNDEALQHLCTTHACQLIERFAMSNCPGVTLAPFRRFIDMLVSHMNNRHYKKCFVYMQEMTSILTKSYRRNIVISNPGLTILVQNEGFPFDRISESIVGLVV